MIKFSVVVPVYNVEKYLKRCMDSILGQTYNNLEIILVDDGSPDNCPKLCDGYAAEDSRVKVIHKNNAGLGMARNTGIENATGDYICFIDSDDFIANNLFEVCAKELSAERYDVIAFDHSIYKKGKIISFEKRKDKILFKGDEVRTSYLRDMIYNPDNKKRFHDCAWSMLYSMKLIKESGFRYVSEREYISEDFYSNLILFSHVESVLAIPESLYYYCYNASSLTNSYNEKRFEKNIYQYEESVKLSEKLGYTDEVIRALAFQILGNTILAFKGVILNVQLDKTSKKNIFHKVVRDKRYQNMFAKLTYDGESYSRKILIWALKHKHSGLIYALIKLKYQKELD